LELFFRKHRSTALPTEALAQVGHPSTNHMFRNYLKVALRNFSRNKVFSFINIAGLSVGMALAILIALWIRDENSFNRQFENYPHIAQVMQSQTFNGVTGSQQSLPFPIGEELKKEFGSDFKYVSMASHNGDHILASGEKKITTSGSYMETVMTEMLSLHMQRGTRAALNDMNSILISAETAKALFGNADPMDKLVKIDNDKQVKVGGVYADLPYNSDFGNTHFIASWKMYLENLQWGFKSSDPWRANMFRAFVQVADHADMQKVSAKIKDVKLKNVNPREREFKSLVFLHPMSRWHLYSEFKNGINTGGRITYVWLFGIIGCFVLLLACINFMNLSTARSEKRAREVGIRKAIGSLRSQLIGQFFGESMLYVLIAFMLSLFFAQAAMGLFNQLADKKMTMPWNQPLFWLAGLLFSLLTGAIAGSYPAFYLSSFDAAKTLKGAFRVGRLASMPRKVLVVIQFSVSVMLIIGTVTIFRQIQFAKSRPVGYSRDGLLMSYMATDELHKHFDAVRQDLFKTGAIAEISESSSAPTFVDEVDDGFEWKNKKSSVTGDAGVLYVSAEFGKTVGWQVIEGRDFSRSYVSDSTAIILNETAAKFMGLKHPVGETIRWMGKPYQVIGLVKDLIMESPYEPVFRTIFLNSDYAQNFVNIRINPRMSAHEAIEKIAPVFKSYNPAQPFDYKFVDEEFARKFSDEERVGKLAGSFAVLAIFISCLGLFGMASFMAEQRTREIGVRKVLGATVFNLWRLLSREFVVLVLISLLIAIPVSYYYLHGWLQQYTYRTEISWWIFASAGFGALFITLFTVSFQAVRAAMANPVNSLRSE
jgi:putative ABC transport system permease protein